MFRERMVATRLLLVMGIMLTLVIILILTVSLFCNKKSHVQESHHANHWEGYTHATLSTDTHEQLQVVIADTLEKRIQGLSGTSPLVSHMGMLFVFDEIGKHSFWMKDMNYSIDIFWFDEEYFLVHVERDVSPETYPRSFGGEVDSKYVLETKSGVLGDIVNIRI